ncbi:nitrophenyl compound nitroreductase subunit ArsF family protein [Tenuifilum thalassicum]|uniref:Thioredoxin domain-containing protein n=1 Tax=Tenuifilum thalassicum TaxID=2590900 RepID=A0A7D3XL45_9BACT|nr:nitrophenyl compound nitroreductase subunit ArsF family protein [Tenuifilum thalassicum]QKG79156.1 hypothetical protein FHG85_02385 [Tenuifilum thalassicum]
MKTLRYLLLFTASLTIASCQGKVNSQANDSSDKNSGSPVTIYYFHGEHRCPTCLAIEKETKTTFEVNLSKEAEAGTVEFEVINADEAKNQALCEKYGVYGSTLLLVKGNKTVNLTNMAFSNARRNPDQFREELANEVKKLIKG